MKHVKDITITLIAALYHLVLFGGTAYLVYYKDASPWIFLLSLMMTLTLKTKD